MTLIHQQPVLNRCQARAKRTGEQCGLWASHGVNVCRKHGASAPQVRAKRARIIEQERVDRRVNRLISDNALPDEAPVDALRRLSAEGRAFAAVLREHLSDRGTILDPNGQVSHVAAAYLTALEKVTRMMEGLVDRELASEERAARIEEKDAELLIRAARSAAYAPRVGLSPEQATALLEEMQRRLLAAA